MAAERLHCILLCLSIFHLLAVYPQGRENEAGVFCFINYWPGRFRIWPTCLHIHLVRWSLWEVCWWRPLDTSVRHCTYLRGGFSLQTPQLSDHSDQWATFLPREQGLHFDTNPAGRHWIGGGKKGGSVLVLENIFFWRENIGDDQTHVSVVCSILLCT